MTADKSDAVQMAQRIRASSGVELLLRLSSFVGPLERIDAIGLAIIHETLRELDAYRTSYRKSLRLTLKVGMVCERRALAKLGYADDRSTSLFLQSYWRWQRGPLREAIWNRTDAPETTRLGCLRAMVRGVYGMHGFAGELSLASCSAWLRREFGIDITSMDLLAHFQSELYAKPRTSFVLLDEQGGAVPDRRAIRDSLRARTHRDRRFREEELDRTVATDELEAPLPPETAERARELRASRMLLEQLRTHARERCDRPLEAAIERIHGDDAESQSFRRVARKFGLTVASVRAGHDRMIRLALQLRSSG